MKPVMSEIARDLSVHLQQEVGRVIERHTATAQVVVQPFEAAAMILELAVSLTISAAATAAAVARDKAGAVELYDLTMRAIAQSAGAQRDRSLAAVEQRRAGLDS